MLEEAFRYPTTGEDALERLLIGGVLSILSVLVLPAFLVYGYLVRCVAAVAAGEEVPPAFDDWEGLFVDGLKAFVIGVAYALVPFVLSLLVFVPFGVGAGTSGNGASGVLAGIGVLAFLVLAAVTLVVVYVFMAAITTFAVEGRLGAAFDVGAVGRLATSEPYVVAIVLAIVVQVVVGLVVTAAIVFTLGLALRLLFPLGAFVQFWTYLVTVYLFGAAYRDAIGETTGEGTAVDA